MKRFLLRLLAVHPLAILTAACLLPPATVWSWREAGQVGAPERAIHYEARQTRAWLGGQIASVRTDLFREVHEARIDVLTRSERQIALARQDAFAHLAQIQTAANVLAEGLQTSVNSQLSTLNGTVNMFAADTSATLAATREDLRPSFANVQTVTGNFAALTAKDGDLPGTLRDTRFFMARAARTAGHIEQAADAIEGSAKEFHADLPKYLAIGQQIGTNVQGVTANLNTLTHPRLVDRILGYTLSGASLYRDLNPGYNVGAGIRGLFTKHQEQ